MNIGSGQLKSKRKVGTLNGRTVMSIDTVGGLNLLMAAKGNQWETLAASPHQAISRFMAKKRYDNLQLTELSKADEVPLSAFESLLPKYEEVTQAIREIQGD